MKKNGTKTAKRRMPARQVRDVNNRNILKDPLLCSQFLRDYVDKELFKELQPEDIEDESEKYQAYLGISFETDTVKRIRMRSPQQDTPLYLISETSPSGIRLFFPSCIMKGRNPGRQT